MYTFVGGCTFIISFSSFYLFKDILLWDLNLSNALSIVLAVLFAYVTNKLFVFKTHCRDRSSLLHEFGSFVGSRAITMLLEFGGVFLLGDIIGINGWIAKILMTVIVVILNYILSKLFVFKKAKIENK